MSIIGPLAMSGVALVAGVLADPSPMPESLSDPFVWITPGAVVVAILTGWIVPGSLYKREREENTRLRAQIDEKIFPVLDEYARVMTRVGDALERTTDALRRERETEPRYRR